MKLLRSPLYLKFLMQPMTHLLMQLLEAMRAAARAEGLSHMDCEPKNAAVH